MDAMIIYIQPFFDWLVQTTLIASVVICLILAIQKTLGGRLGPRWCHALWLVLLVRMALPWAPPSPLGLSNLIPSWDIQTQARQSPGTVEVQEISLPEQAAETPEVTPSQEPESQLVAQKQAAPSPRTPANAEGESWLRSASIRRALPILWLGGAIVIGVYLLVSDLALWRIVKRDRPLLNQPMLELFEECKAQMGVQSLVAVVPSEQVRSPGLFGFVRPRLLLPRQMLDTATRDEMRYVFLHELAHLRRHDIYLGWLASILQVLHWFNPFIWFAFYRMRADRELACDALVLTRTGQDKSQEYGGAIVGLVRRFSQSRPLPAMAGVIESKSQLKRRIAMITQFKHNSYRFSPLATVLIVILASVSLPDAISMQTSKTSTSESEPPISIRRIWAGPGVDLEGAPSPDGRYISYTDWETGDLAFYEIATDKKRRLTNKGTWDDSDEFAQCSRWSPDGRQIVYDWYNKEDFIELRIVGLDGSEPRILYRNKEVIWAQTYDWSPDGKNVLAILERKDGDRIALVSIEDGSVRVLKTLRHYPHNMVFSPDGRYIVYDFPPKEDSPEHDICLLLADGSREVPLVEHPADDGVLGWTPDGKNIIFASDRTGSPSVWSIAIANGIAQGIPKLVKPDIGQKFIPMGFTQGGSFYYGSGGAGASDVYTAKLDPQTGNVLSPPKKAIQRFEGYNRTPNYSPDGKYMAYVTNRGRSNFLCIRHLETGQEREFPSKRGRILGPRWSPDGNSILIACRDYYSNLYGIYLVNVQTGVFTPVVLPSENSRLNSHEWSRDGKAFFLGQSSAKDKRSQIMLREIESGKEKEIYNTTNFERFRLACSPDGKWLGFINMRNKDNNALRIIPSSGGEPRELYTCEPQKEQLMTLEWTADGNYILLVKREIEQKKFNLWRLPIESGKAQQIDLGINNIIDLSVHPDGQHIALGTWQSQPAEVWVMENFLPTTAVAKPEPMTMVRRLDINWGTFASLSPDGKYLCDVDWDTENLAVLELATGKTRHLTAKSPDDAGYPLESAISPDSREVAYLWWNPDTKASSLHVVSLDGSGHRLLCERKHPVPKAWSADSKKILAVVSENDVQQMVWISASDGSIQHIASFNGESLGYPGKFDISPDGRFIAYDRPQAENTSQRDIVVFDLDKNIETSLVEHPADDKLLGWTPDGSGVLFASDRTGSWDTWLLQVPGGKPQGFPKLAKQGIGDVRPIGFTPDGSYYYAQERILEDVFTARLDLETGEVLSEPVPVRQTGATDCHDWSPDGKYLAYCERRADESRIIHIRTLATGRDRTLADQLPYIRWLRWSLDGGSILIDGATRGDSQGVISKIDVRTGGHSDLVRSETEVLIRPEMSPDGKTLYFDRVDPKSNTTRLMARDLKSGREKELFRVESPARLTGSALSPDGQQFVLSIMPSRSGPEGPVLKILSTSGGPARDLIQFKVSEKLRAVGVTWMPDNQNVIFWKWLEGFKDLELWRISAEGGGPRRLWSRSTRGQMRIHPDGQHVAFDDRSTTRSIWVMENFLPEGTGK